MSIEEKIDIIIDEETEKDLQPILPPPVNFDWVWYEDWIKYGIHSLIDQQISNSMQLFFS